MLQGGGGAFAGTDAVAGRMWYGWADPQGGGGGTLERFENMLAGGHPRSLGRWRDAVDAVIAAPGRFPELFECLYSTDKAVRGRAASTLTELWLEPEDFIVPYLQRMIDLAESTDEAPYHWVFAEVIGFMDEDMTAAQHAAAVCILKCHLQGGGHWRVLCHSMATLTEWSADDAALRQWLLPQLRRLQGDPRSRVVSTATIEEIGVMVYDDLAARADD